MHSDGYWETWEGWSSCSHTCGAVGIRRRTRNCNFDKNRYPGRLCLGSSEELDPCNRTECPQDLDGGWSAWSPWSACDASCGNGFKHRQRNCTNPVPKPNGRPCTGNYVSTTQCSVVDCPTGITHSCPSNPYITWCRVLDGAWGHWTGWSTCSPTCGRRSKRRTRSCDYPKPKDGGSNCVGSHSELQLCAPIPCPCDGRYSGWSFWSPCSVTCGQGGFKTRNRTCSDPPPSYGGTNCSGTASETTGCTAERACAQNGNWSDYGSFSDCSHDCNGGIRVAYRTCSAPPPTNEGYECVGPNSKVTKYGGWGNWQAWSKCDKRCGIGHKTRKRQCDSPPPNAYGAPCPVNGIETMECWIHDCPVGIDLPFARLLVSRPSCLLVRLS
ncbi:hemicentin-1-like [Corticium candelabrum]|uniref:hemicentin-1-like n=1 Tax=Corticium candelabrum TaxID=121492 RepID=UPI002E261551|nr:hemicentin-1-like [Corticium candelabrum]